MPFTEKSVIFFDLDGTIVDSSLGITNSVMFALKRYGFAIPPREELYFFVGPPLNESFERYCNFSREESFAAVEVYREYYRERGMYENAIYPGMRALFSALKAQGRQVWLATSKPEVFAEKIAVRFGFAEFLDGVVGSLLDGRRVKKDEVVAEALARASVRDKSKALMVGDRKHDIFGASANGIDSVGVLYGFGDRAELEGAGATAIAETVRDLRRLLL